MIHPRLLHALVQSSIDDLRRDAGYRLREPDRAPCVAYAATQLTEQRHAIPCRPSRSRPAQRAIGRQSREVIRSR